MLLDLEAAVRDQDCEDVLIGGQGGIRGEVAVVRLGTIQQDGSGLVGCDHVRDGRARAYISRVGGIITTDIRDLTTLQICGIGGIDIH